MIQYLKLGSLTRIRTGKLDANAADDNGKYPFFTCSKEPLSINTCSYDCECVLVAGNGDLNVKYYDGKFDAYQRTYIIESLDKTKLMVKYLYCFLDLYVEILRQQAIGGVIKYIKLGNLADAIIPVPVIEKQREIIEIFEKCNGTIAYRHQELLLMDQLVKSRFIEMFGDPVTNPLRWAMLPLEKCLTVLGGYAFKSEEFKTSGVPVLRIGNINTGAFTPTNMVYWSKDDCLTRYQVLPGDLVISLTGTVGKDDYGNVCILGDAYPMYYLNQRNAKLILDDELNKHYLSELLKFSQIKKKLTGISRGVRQANISNRDILNLVVPIPPIEIQVQFAAFVEQVDKSKFEIQQSLEKLEILKKSLMQQYFG